MDVLSNEEMLAREAEVFQTGMTPTALMDAAGEALAERLLVIYPKASLFLVLVGKGNNGGDGLVVARELAEAGKPVRVILTAAADELGTVPIEQLERLHRAFPNLEITPWRSDLDFPGSDGVIVDALLGIQAKGPLRGNLPEIVRTLNGARASNFFRTAALDLPSGLAAYAEGDAPKDPDAAVIADVTMAVGFAKEVLCREALSAWVGRLEIVRWDDKKMAEDQLQVLVGNELAGLLPRRSAFSNKGDFGRLAIVAGSLGFTGAPVLCSQAAQAMGAGLLSVVTRHDAAAIVAAHAPAEAMVSGWAESAAASKVVEQASAIVIGPGLGVDAVMVRMLRVVLAVGCPVLIDADGLNALAQNLDLLQEAKGPVLLTPHPGEMARLLGRKFSVEEREAAARAFTDRYDVTLVLKGTRTLVVARGGPFFVNTTGNPGLSTGGSGDTLSGILGALLAQGLEPLDAARLGVWLHGHAADLVLAGRGCEEGMTPTMLSGSLGAALVSLRAQATRRPGLVERAENRPR